MREWEELATIKLSEDSTSAFLILELYSKIPALVVVVKPRFCIISKRIDNNTY